MTSPTRQYGRDDVEYETWYSTWAKTLASNYTRGQLEERLYGVSVAGKKAAASHLRAIDATHSMQSQSARRANTRNVVAASGDERLAISGAIEIHELFPEHALADRNC